MNKLFIVGILSFLSSISFAQKTIGIGTNAPNTKAVLDVVVEAPAASPQGMLLPRLTTTQKNAMPLGATDIGMIVFDTDLGVIDSWNGLAWSSTLPSTSSGWDAVSSTGDVTTTLNVGVGVSNPTQNLEVNGDVILGGGASGDGTSEFLQFKAESESWYMGPYNNANPALSDFYISTVNGGDGTFHIEAGTGNVGIGITTPNSTLTVAGTMQSDSIITKEFQLATNPGTGKVLKSDAAGNGKWIESIEPIFNLTADFVAPLPNIIATSWPTAGDIGLAKVGATFIIGHSSYSFSPNNHLVHVTPLTNASVTCPVNMAGGEIEVRCFDENGTPVFTFIMVTVYEY